MKIKCNKPKIEHMSKDILFCECSYCTTLRNREDDFFIEWWDNNSGRIKLPRTFLSERRRDLRLFRSGDLDRLKRIFKLYATRDEKKLPWDRFILE